MWQKIWLKRQSFASVALRLGTVLALLLAAQIAAGVPAARAIGFTVDTTNDSVDAIPGDGNCQDAIGQCSLRAAIQETNALGGVNTINLPDNHYMLTIPGPNEDNAVTGDLDIQGNLTITGTGPNNPVVDGNHLDRVFHIVPIGGITVKFERLTIIHGRTPDGGGGAAHSPGGNGGNGGGIYSSSILTLSRCVVKDNSTGNGGNGGQGFGVKAGDGGVGGHGGGIFTDWQLTLIDSTVEFNQTGNGGNGGAGVEGVACGDGGDAGDGGGIFNTEGTVSLSHSTVNNSSTGNGGSGGSGALASSGGSGGKGGDGGGIAQQPSGFGGEAVSATNSTVSTNLTGSGGSGGTGLGAGSGGLGGSGGDGGGIFSGMTTALGLTHTTTTGNSTGPGGMGGGSAAPGSVGDGGGLFLGGGTARAKNTVLANNTAGSGQDCKGPLTSQNYNLIKNPGGCVISGSTSHDLIGVDPNLGGLANNGGSTHTHALLTGSPAIDTIPAGSNECGTTITDDQRAVIRPQGTSCDMGSFEWFAAPEISVVKTADDYFPVPGQVVTFTIAIQNNGLVSATGGIVSDPLPSDLTLAGAVGLNPPSAGTVGSPPTLVTGLTVGAGKTVNVTFPATVNPGLSQSTLITNTASVSATQLVSGTVSITGSVIIVSPAPQLTINKQVSDRTPQPGQVVTYTIVVHNSGSLAATNAVVSDTLDSQLTLVGPILLVPPGAGTVGSPPALVTGLTVAAGQSVTITFPVKVSASVITGTRIGNIARITSTEIPLATIPVTGSVQIDVGGAPDNYLPMLVK